MKDFKIQVNKELYIQSWQVSPLGNSLISLFCVALLEWEHRFEHDVIIDILNMSIVVANYSSMNELREFYERP